MKKRFTLTCNKCGSDAEIDTAYGSEHWDDGYAVVCTNDKCDNRADNDYTMEFPPPVDPVKAFHIGKGCCDGSDPSGCYNRQLKAEVERKVEERRATRNEYYGTEPSKGDVIFCPSNKNHARMKMGDKCPYCGYVA